MEKLFFGNIKKSATHKRQLIHKNRNSIEHHLKILFSVIFSVVKNELNVGNLPMRMLWVITELLLSHRSGLRSVINGTKLSGKACRAYIKMINEINYCVIKFDKVFQKNQFVAVMNHHKLQLTVSQSPSQHSGNFLCGFIIKKNLSQRIEEKSYSEKCDCYLEFADL